MSGRKKVLADKKSFYYQVVVTESGGVRYLKFGNEVLQGAVDDHDHSVLPVEYTRYLPLGLALNPGCRSLLAVGLGAGSVPRLLAKHCPQIKVRVVEIDIAVVEMAKRYFHLDDNSAFEIVIADGRSYLKRNKNTYDWIILDAYHAQGIPFHLTTVEFLRLVKSRLNRGGVVTTNIWATDWKLYLSMLRTYAKVFSNMYRFLVPGRKNVVLIACDFELSPEDLQTNALKLQKEARIPYDLAGLTANLDRKPLDFSLAPVLSDDQAPLDWLNRQGG